MKETLKKINETGVRLAGEGLHEDAIATFREGLLSDKKNHILLFNLALSYRALGRNQEAKATLIQASQANPFDADILDTLGVVLYETGDKDAAEECYKNALKISPESGRVWNNYGVLQFGQERFSEAVLSFEKAVALVPEFDDALYNLRDTYEALGRMEERDTCAQILEKRGFNPD